MVRRPAPPRLRRAPAVRARAGRRAVRAVRSARRSGGQQPVVGRARGRETAGAGLSRRDGSRRPARRALPLLQPRATPRRAIASRRGCRGADCRRRACCARDSPATASIACSRSGRRPSAPSCSRSINPARASCRRAGGNSARHRWRELVEPHRLAFVVATLERLVERLEAISGRRLDRDALRERLERVNRQEEIFDAARRLIASARRTPGADDRADHQRDGHAVGARHRTGRSRTRAHSTTRCEQRVDAGVAACPGERRG